jgi:flagellar basal-body rod protein FlgG
MNEAFHIGAIGLRSQQVSLDVIANNVANINTPGFKRSEIRFSELVNAQLRDGVPESPETEQSLAQRSLTMGGVAAVPRLDIDRIGEIERTGRALDFAIDGPGFVEVLGPEGRALLWRGGSLSVDPDGYLATDDGVLLRPLISVPMDARSVEIGRDGRIFATTDADPERREIGQITLVKPHNMEGLGRIDGGYYQPVDGDPLIEAVPGEDGMGTLIAGARERSNVELSREMVDMLLVQRAYSANAQVLQAADRLISIANELQR